MNTAEVFLPLTHDTQLVVAVRKGSEELNLVLAGPNAGLMMYTNTLVPQAPKNTPMGNELKVRSTGWKPVYCTHAPIGAWGLAVFQRQVTYPCAKFKARKALFLCSVELYMWHCVFSRAALEEISKIGLELKVLRPEAHFLRWKEEGFL